MSSTDDEEGRGGRQPGFLVVEAILGFGLLLSRKSLQMVEPPFQAKYGGGSTSTLRLGWISLEDVYCREELELNLHGPLGPATVPSSGGAYPAGRGPTKPFQQRLA